MCPSSLQRHLSPFGVQFTQFPFDLSILIGSETCGFVDKLFFFFLQFWWKRHSLAVVSILSRPGTEVQSVSHSCCRVLVSSRPSLDPVSVPHASSLDSKLLSPFVGVFLSEPQGWKCP